MLFSIMAKSKNALLDDTRGSITPEIILSNNKVSGLKILIASMITIEGIKIVEYLKNYVSKYMLWWLF